MLVCFVVVIACVSCGLGYMRAMKRVFKMREMNDEIIIGHCSKCKYPLTFEELVRSHDETYYCESCYNDILKDR